MEGLSGQFLGGQFAAVGSQTGWSGLRGTLLLPGLKVPDSAVVLRVLDPLDDLGHGHKVDIIVRLNDLINPVEESIKVGGVILQPSGVEEESQGSPVLVIMTVEVVSKEVVELISAQDV